MTARFDSAWEPHSDPDADNLIEESDAMRRLCPVAHGGPGKWYVLGHRETTNVLLDHETFSNEVSSRLSVPNGMDPPAHTPFRRLIEPLFSREYLAPIEAPCRAIAEELIVGAVGAEKVEVMDEIAYPFAGRAQCAFLGWPDALASLLVEWTRRNQAAARAADRAMLRMLAAQFEAVVADLLRRFRQNRAARNRVMNTLLEARVDGRPLNDEELTSLFRNWTVGEIGTISASVGIVLQAMAVHPGLQAMLRAQREKLPAAIDEILRAHGPLVSNRRRAKYDSTIGGCPIQAGDELNIMWTAANRDESVFDRPDEIMPERDGRLSLLYGAGIHVCPGAPLARLELLTFMEECLNRCRNIESYPAEQPAYARHPAGGYSRISLRFN
ncbi:MAG: cytochrome P450 [Candidatus Hydrogenedentota bacterium]